MPIEIKELVIKVNVGGNDTSQKTQPTLTVKQGSEKLEDVAESISDEILEILKRKEER